MATLLYKINNVDKTSLIRNLVIKDSLTQKVDTCSFILADIAGGNKPIEGQDIKIYSDSVLIFAGNILSAPQTQIDPGYYKYAVRCVDYSRRLDKRRIVETYEDKTCYYIINDIISNYYTEFTVNNVQTGMTVEYISFNYKSGFQCIKELAKLTGFDWYVDYESDIHFFTAETNDAPYELTEADTRSQDSNIVLHLKMNDNLATKDVLDVSPELNHGTANQNTANMSTVGKINEALDFDGAADYVDFGDVLDTGTADFSLCAWIKMSDFSNAGYIFCKGSYESANSPSYALSVNNNISAGMRDNVSGQIRTNWIPTGLENTWIYIVAVFDRSGYLKLYVNGVYKSQVDISGVGSCDNAHNLRVGVYSANAVYRNFNGDIDDVRIYSKVLSDQEIEILYNQGAGREDGIGDWSTGRYRNLNVSVDKSQLKNTVYVRGGYYLSNLWEEKIKADGEQEAFVLAYEPYSPISVYVDTGGGFVAKTLGIDNIDDTGYDFVVNVAEKVILNLDLAKLNSGDVLKITYKYQVPILIMDEDPDSIAAIKAIEGGEGIYDYQITDEEIATLESARDRAAAELRQYANALVKGSFITDQSGYRSGQILTVNISSRAVDGKYLIQTVTTKVLFGGALLYTVTFATLLSGLTDFLLSLYDSGLKIITRDDEILDEIVRKSDTVTFSEAAITFSNEESSNFQYGPGGSPQGVYGESSYA